MKLNPQIFREYDVRGVVGRDLTPESVEWLGKAFGTYLRERGFNRAVIGGDCRISTGIISEETPNAKELKHICCTPDKKEAKKKDVNIFDCLFDNPDDIKQEGDKEDQEIQTDGLMSAMARGLTSTGIDLIDVGIVPTPVLYFSMFALGVDAGVMVTGSHNPPEFNGFKLCANKVAIYGEEIKKVAKIADEGRFVQGEGKITTHDIIPTYRQRLLSFARLGPRNLKVVVDAGNGCGGFVAVPLLEELGKSTRYEGTHVYGASGRYRGYAIPVVIEESRIKVIPLFCDMDGRFPNHHPDPTILSNLEALRREVIDKNADIGIAFDGDADRLGVVTDTGEVIYGDMILLILARALLSEEPGAEIVSEVKCSQSLFDGIEKAGGKPVMWKVGHSLIKAKMAEDGALLGGEMSGHIFFRHRYYGYDDAIYAAVRLLEVLSNHFGPVGSLLADVPKMTATPEIRIACPDEIKFDVVGKVTSSFKEKGYRVIDVDGARVIFDDGWGLVRASNTQPVLVLRFEAKSEKALEEIKRVVTTEIEKIREEIK